MNHFKNVFDTIIGLILISLLLLIVGFGGEKIGIFNEDESERCGDNKHMRTETFTNAYGSESSRVCVRDRNSK